MFLLTVRILETSQKPLHLIAQPWNSSQTFLMRTAIWRIAFRFLHVHFLSDIYCMFSRWSLFAPDKWVVYFLTFIPVTFLDCVWLDRLWWTDEEACEHCGWPAGKEPLAFSPPSPQHALPTLAWLPQSHCWTPWKPLPGQGTHTDQSK